ncbi:MAG: hypothetical protein K6G85_00160 [Eubacterium sp.]|nr:hypothetical protein [Eubacterium sp.]
MAKKNEEVVQEEVVQAEDTANKVIKEAEETAKKIIEDAKKEVMEMIAAANQQTTYLPPSAFRKAEAEEEKASLPQYLKEMQESLKKKTSISLFSDGEKYKDDVFVSVNGDYRYQIQRGQVVEVPGFIAQVENLSHNQDIRTNEMMRAKQDATERRMQEMNGLR